jgi:hypothetical protein
MISKKTASLVISACIDLPVYINLSNKCNGYRLPVAIALYHRWLPVVQFLAGIIFFSSPL